MEATQKTSIFERWLYRNYRQGSALSAFIRQRMQPMAWLIMGGGITSALMGANFDLSIVVLMTLLAFCLLCVGLLWAFLRSAHISAVRQIPRTGAVGEELSYVVSVKNEGRWAVRDVSFVESGNDPRPTQWEFVNLKEPGEESRNAFDQRLGFYRWKWLVESGGCWDGGEASEAYSLKAGEIREVRLSLTPKRRGVLKLNDLRVELPDPLGLFQRRRATLNDESEVLVIPKRYRLPDLSLEGESELKVGADTASTIRGEGGEFMGLREYRAGDSLRKIHWKAWARSGQPIVKEYEELRFPRYGLVLDTSLLGSSGKLLEEAISVAASFVSTMDRESCLLDLMFVQKEPEVFTAGRGVAKVDRLMEVLARVEGSDDGAYESLSRLVMRYAKEMTACVVVLTGWSEARKEFLGRLRAAGLMLRVYVIGVGEAPHDESLAGVRWLRRDHMQEDLMSV